MLLPLQAGHTRLDNTEDHDTRSTSLQRKDAIVQFSLGCMTVLSPPVSCTFAVLLNSLCGEKKGGRGTSRHVKRSTLVYCSMQADIEKAKGCVWKASRALEPEKRKNGAEPTEHLFLSLWAHALVFCNVFKEKPPDLWKHWMKGKD